MASFGKVLDLLDDRYLNLQDVIGNVERLPTLVPYEQYTQNVLVYRMDTEPHVFMGLIQDFIMRMAQERRKELWTWCVQWNVEAFIPPAPSPKKPRLDMERLHARSDAQPPQRKAPVFNVTEQRVIDARLLRKEEFLRILAAIVQVESSIVPNFIEFLYRWIDFYQGDGIALKAALRREIPSLWDFEYHPLLVPEDLKGMEEEHDMVDNAGAQHEVQENGSVEEVGKTLVSSNAKELAQNSPTKKMREKPDLAALLLKKEESERLHYREVRYGIQPPKLDESFPPLINVPRDKYKRMKYYAACFRSRQRALSLLFEAGITFTQISHYRLSQEEHPVDTPLSSGSGGLIWFRKESELAQGRHEQIEKEMVLKEKSMEVKISNKLAAEAQLAARVGGPGGPSGVPLIPATPTTKVRFDDAEVTTNHVRSKSESCEEKINIVPSQLVNRMKSKLFEGSIDRNGLAKMLSERDKIDKNLALQGKQDTSLDAQHVDATAVQSNVFTGSTISQGFHSPIMAPSELPLPLATSSAQPLSSVTSSSVSIMQNHRASANHGISTSSLADGTHSPQFDLEEYMRNLSSEQAQRLAPMMIDGARQLFANGGNAFSTAHSAPDSSMSLFGTTYTPAPPLPRPPPLPQLSTSTHSLTQVQSQFPQSEPVSIMRPAQPLQNIPQPYTSGSQSLGPTREYFEEQTRPSASQMPQLTSFHAESRSTSQYVNLQSQNHFSNANSLVMPGPPSWPLGSSHTNIPSTRQGINRNAPSPLNLAPQPPSPLSSLAPTLSAVSPLAPSSHRIPVQIYFPKIVIPGNLITGGDNMGDDNMAETDAMLLGTCCPGSGKLVLNRAIFLPIGVWKHTLHHASKGAYTVLETYAPSESHPSCSRPRVLPFLVSSAGNSKEVSGPHNAAYLKLAQACSIMACSRDRENNLTKRWRATPGPMTNRARGSVWEGWAATLDREIEMSAQERVGAFSWSGLVDEGVGSSMGGGHRVGASDTEAEDSERRRAMIDEILIEEHMD